MSLKSRSIALGALLAVVIIGGGLFVVYANGSKKIAQAESAKPSFVLNATDSKGWWSAGNAYPAEGITKDYVGDPAELPTVTMTVHRDKDSTRDGCFVSYAYYKGHPIDIEAKLQERARQVTQKSSTLTLAETSVQKLPITIGQAEEPMKLYQYNLSGAYAGELMRGIEFGYLNAQQGYIEVEGTCMTNEQLSGTLQVIQAIRFDEAVGK